MASLTSTMLNLAGVPAHLVWIGTRDIPYRYVENPSMSVDNHMIAPLSAMVNGSFWMLPTTVLILAYLHLTFREKKQ